MKRLVAIGLLLASIGHADAQQQPAPGEMPDAPVIVFESTKYDFGPCAPGPSKATFKVKNTGRAVLEIREVMPACPGCTRILDFDKRIEPGKEGTITAELNTTGMKGHVDKGIRVTSNDPKTPTVTLSMIAQIREDLSITPSHNVWLGKLRPESQTNQTVEIKSVLAEPLVIEKVENSAPWLTARIVSSTSNTAKIEVASKPPLPWGYQNANVILHTRYAKYSNVVLNVSAQVPSLISVVPSSLLFNKGKSKTIGVIAMRNDGKDFQITDIKNPSSLLSVAVSTNVPGRSYRLNFTYTPRNGTQPENARIELLTDEKDCPKVELPFEFR